MLLEVINAVDIHNDNLFIYSHALECTIKSKPLSSLFLCNFM